MTPHLRDEDLINLHFGLFEPDSEAKARAHVHACADCTKRMDALVTLLQSGLDQLQGPALASEELIERTIEAARIDGVISSSREQPLLLAESPAEYLPSARQFDRTLRVERAAFEPLPREPAPAPLLATPPAEQRRPRSHAWAWALAAAVAVVAGSVLLVPLRREPTLQIAAVPQDATSGRAAVAPREEATLETPAPAMMDSPREAEQPEQEAPDEMVLARLTNSMEGIGMVRGFAAAAPAAAPAPQMRQRTGHDGESITATQGIFVITRTTSSLVVSNSSAFAAQLDPAQFGIPSSEPVRVEPGDTRTFTIPEGP